MQGSQLGSSADSADTEAGPVSIDKAGFPRDSSSQEGLTPSDPSFSRPAPCLLPEHHQARNPPPFSPLHLPTTLLSVSESLAAEGDMICIIEASDADLHLRGFWV